MRWVVLVAGTAPDDLAAICEAAHAPAAARLSDSIEDVVAEAPDGILVVGADADLALVAHQAHQRGIRFPIGLVPSIRSDLLRMFGLDRDSVLDRLQTGERYTTDLGECKIASATIPFVAHVSARRSSVGAGGNEVAIALGERSYDLRSRLILVANGQHFRGRTIAPRGAVMDGQLDFQSIGGSALRRARSMRRARRGLHLADRNVWRRSAASGEVSLGSGWSVSIDARAAGTGSFAVQVVPGAFELWI